MLKSAKHARCGNVIHLADAWIASVREMSPFGRPHRKRIAVITSQQRSLQRADMLASGVILGQYHSAAVGVGKGMLRRFKVWESPCRAHQIAACCEQRHQQRRASFASIERGLLGHIYIHIQFNKSVERYLSLPRRSLVNSTCRRPLCSSNQLPHSESLRSTGPAPLQDRTAFLAHSHGQSARRQQVANTDHLPIVSSSSPSSLISWHL